MVRLLYAYGETSTGQNKSQIKCTFKGTTNNLVDGRDIRKIQWHQESQDGQNSNYQLMIKSERNFTIGASVLLVLKRREESSEEFVCLRSEIHSFQKYFCSKQIISKLLNPFKLKLSPKTRLGYVKLSQVIKSQRKAKSNKKIRTKHVVFVQVYFRFY